jgi:hypothetical protein
MDHKMINKQKLAVNEAWSHASLISLEHWTNWAINALFAYLFRFCYLWMFVFNVSCWATFREMEAKLFKCN